MGTIYFAQDVRFWLALLYAPGIGARQYQQILQHYETPEAFLATPQQTMRQETRALSPRTLKYLKAPDWQRVDKDLDWAETNACCILTLTDPRYPVLLREIPDPPPVLFLRGNPDLLNTAQIAVVGSRNPSPGGKHSASEFARGLCHAGLTITSGLALGIDAASHHSALDSGGKTIAVAGTGPDRIYPARHRDLASNILEQGAIVSEFPPGTPPLASNFPRRNRIISGLSLGTLVVEAALQSGSLITARLAAEQGREVFALPGSIHNPLARGCHALIRQGAKLTESVQHILEELAPMASVLSSVQSDVQYPSSEAPAQPHSDGIENAFMENHMGYEAVDIDTLVDRSGLTADTVSAMLVSLELQGRVISTGGLYCRTDISR